jgi:UDP-perosamine 4-acetyltransferase
MMQRTWTDALVCKPLIVIGSGGHARVLIDTLCRLGANILFITERDRTKMGAEVLGVRVAGEDALIHDHSPDSVLLVNGIGSADSLRLRNRIRLEWIENGYNFATIVHPAATVSELARLLPGAQIMAGAVIQSGAQIGRDTIVNTSASVDHDCLVGECVQISPGVTLCGNVVVGDLAHIGAGAVVIQGIQIGRQALVGAGSVVVRNVDDDQTVVGNPAKPLIRKK